MIRLPPIPPLKPLLITILATLSAHAGARRYARVGEFQGDPEVQLHASDRWRPAVRNLALVESSRMRSVAEDRVEIEMDDGSFLRFAGDALAELSDYSQLSTGQRITMVSLDHGVAYFTGEPRPHDTLSLAMPGVQITLREGSRVRLDATPQASAVAVLEGTIRFTTQNIEIDLRAGQFATIDPASPAHFNLVREIPKREADAWSEARDKATSHSSSAAYVAGAGYGLSDIDHSGAWIVTPDGMVWKPRMLDDWRPFRDGRWEWYDEGGFTWISAEPWGWLPYHYGRWIQDSSQGWVWSPDHRSTPLYKPGDVYWLRGADRIAWGPLAPAESWTGAGRSQYYAPANSTVANFKAGDREIDPATFDPKLAAKPSEALAGMGFTVAPPSPPLPADRLEAQRPELKTTVERVPFISTVAPAIPNAAYEPPGDSPTPQPSAPEPAAVSEQPVEYVASPEPEEVYYPVSAFTGIVVVGAPFRHDDQRTGNGAWDRHGTAKPHEPPRVKHIPDPIKPEPPKSDPARPVKGENQQK